MPRFCFLFKNRSDLAGGRGAVGGEGQGRSELDEGGHHDCGLQEAAYARECVSFILSVFLVSHFDSLFLHSYRSRLDREGEAVQQGIHEPDGHLIHGWSTYSISRVCRRRWFTFFRARRPHDTVVFSIRPSHPLTRPSHEKHNCKTY